MRRILKHLQNASTAVAAVTTLLLMFLTAADGTARYILNRPIIGAYELTNDYLMVIIVFFAVVYAYNTSAFVRITLVVDRLPIKLRKVCWFLSQLVTAVVALLLAWAAFQQVIFVFQDGTTSSGILRYPLWPAYAVIAVCLTLLTLNLFLDLEKSISGRSPLFLEPHDAEV